MNAKTIKIALSRGLALYTGAKSSISRISPQLEKRTARNRFLRIARDTLQEIAASVQQSAHESISRIVTECLTSSFPDEWEFKLEFVKSRGKTEAHLDFWKNGVKNDPIMESAGGVLDVAAFGLRLACVMLRPEVEKILILDEPFRMVGEEDVPRVRSMIEEVSHKLKVQIIMVTHNENLVTGNHIQLKRKGK